MIRKFLIIAQPILIAILAIAFFASVRSCSINEDNTSIALHKADSSFLTAKYYENKNGELIGQVSTHELTIKQYKEYGEQLGFDNQSLKMENKKLKNLVAHWQGEASMRDTFRVTLYDTVTVRDGKPIPGRGFNWNNKYLFIDGVIDLGLKNITIGYSYDVDFSLTAYRKPQRGFWKPPGQLVADIYFSDPNFKVTTFKGFVVKEEPKRWYQTTGAKIGFGVVGGAAAYRYLTK